MVSNLIFPLLGGPESNRAISHYHGLGNLPGNDRSGSSRRKWYNSCRKAYQAYEDRVDFIYLAGLPLRKLLEKVEHLLPQTVDISLPVLIDGDGKKFVGNESLALIAQASNAPVYTFWDVCIGNLTIF